MLPNDGELVSVNRADCALNFKCASDQPGVIRSSS
jgi:hypothetical protein